MKTRSNLSRRSSLATAAAGGFAALLQQSPLQARELRDDVIIERRYIDLPQLSHGVFSVGSDMIAQEVRKVLDVPA